MPSKLPIRDRPTAYFDWSTLVYAFEGTSTAADVPRKRLASIVPALARDANLCFSLTHVWELLHREDRGERLAMAAWLEDLTLVWLLPDADVLEAEVRHFVLDVARGIRTSPSLPAVASFLSVFTRWDPTSPAFGRALNNPTIVAMVEELGDDEDDRRRREQFRSLSVEAAKVLYIDRSLASKVRDRDEIDAALDAKQRAGLTTDALRVAGEVRKGLDPSFNDEVRAAIAELPNLQALPYHFLRYRALRNMSFEITARPNVRTRAFERQRGDYYDLAHLVGAAYCDVFTCDATNVKRLDKGREALGRAPPITAEGDVDALVHRIEEQLGR